MLEACTDSHIGIQYEDINSPKKKENQLKKCIMLQKYNLEDLFFQKRQSKIKCSKFSSCIKKKEGGTTEVQQMRGLRIVSSIQL